MKNCKVKIPTSWGCQLIKISRLVECSCLKITLFTNSLFSRTQKLALGDMPVQHMKAAITVEVPKAWDNFLSPSFRAHLTFLGPRNFCKRAWVISFSILAQLLLWPFQKCAPPLLNNVALTCHPVEEEDLEDDDHPMQEDQDDYWDLNLDSPSSKSPKKQSSSRKVRAREVLVDSDVRRSTRLKIRNKGFK